MCACVLTLHYLPVQVDRMQSVIGSAAGALVRIALQPGGGVRAVGDIRVASCDSVAVSRASWTSTSLS